MKSKLLFLALFFSFRFYSQTYTLNKVGVLASNDIQLVKHSFYEIGFNTKQQLPAWTYYSLTKEHLKMAVLERKGSFVKDPFINSLQASNSDYSASGYDKGHLVPCEDMSFSESAMKETFYYSNCAPQTTELNRGEWKVLEELTRNWAKEYEEVLVVSGPVFGTDLKHLGKGEIHIPDVFYKIILRHDSLSYKGIAFLMPNSLQKLNTLNNYVCTIDSIETLTGLDFFTDLPDKTEENFESKIEINNWDWHPSETLNPEKNNGAHHKVISVQCKSITKKGKQCKKRTTSANGYCNLHGGN